MIAKWESRFELKPNKWVFVPTAETIAVGRKIKKSIKECWKPPSYYYHLRSGGHVSALKSHLKHAAFLHLDVQDFFGSINKTRVTRCLKSKVGYAIAREWANISTVIDPRDKKKYIIPFGFVQSQIVAALCLHESALGACIHTLQKNKKLVVSVYVDDIIVSSDNTDLLSETLEKLQEAAKRAGFALNSKKQEGPSASINAFNIVLSHAQLEINEDRLRQFINALEEAISTPQRLGILNYIATVNNDQAEGLAEFARPNP